MFNKQRLIRIEDKLDRILSEVVHVDQGVHHMAVELTEITAAVSENSDVVSSAILLLEDLATRLEAAAGDPAAVADLAATIRGNSANLAAAVAANTVA